jgi:hypothetical protein
MGSMSRKQSPEPRSWDEPEELDRFVHELRDQIDGLRARVRLYREVIGGDDREDRDSKLP